MKEFKNRLENRFPNYNVVGMIPRIKHAEFHLKGTHSKEHECPQCGKTNSVWRKRVRTLTDTPIDSIAMPIVLKLEVHDYRCGDCNNAIYRHTIEEKLSDTVCRALDTKEKSTHALKEWISLQADKKSINTIAKECAMAPSTISLMLQN